MGLTLRVANMFARRHRKRAQSTGGDSSSDKPVESFRRDGIDRVWASSTLTLSDFAGSRILFQNGIGLSVCDGTDVVVERQCAGVNSLISVMLPSVRLARHAASARALRSGRYFLGNLDIMDYVLQILFLASRRFGFFSVADKMGREVVYDTSRMKVYEAWYMRLTQWGKLAEPCVQVQSDNPFYRD